jgi:hypothetical protein
MLTTIGSFGEPSFQRDLDNARRWLTVHDQPDVAFGGAPLNNYAAIWPPEGLPPANPPLAREPLALPNAGSWRTRRIGYEGCCFHPWWHPTDPNRIFTIDGTERQRAGVYQWQLDAANTYDIINQAPPPLWSPDASLEISQIDEQQVGLRRVNDGTEWRVNTHGILPAVSPDNSKLMWMFRLEVDAGQPPAPLEIWISDINGENPHQLAAMQGSGGAQWLDANRLLLSYREDDVVTLGIFDLTDNSLMTLGAWQRPRGLQVAPGGERIMFYVAYPTDLEEAGVYVMDTQPGAIAQKLPWFGSWRWRDADTVYYIPFDSSTNFMQLASYHIPTGESRTLTDPATTTLIISNGDWNVAPDGRRIIFLNAIDLTMWMLEDSSAG